MKYSKKKTDKNPKPFLLLLLFTVFNVCSPPPAPHFTPLSSSSFFLSSLMCDSSSPSGRSSSSFPLSYFPSLCCWRRCVCVFDSLQTCAAFRRCRKTEFLKKQFCEFAVRGNIWVDGVSEERVAQSDRRRRRRCCCGEVFMFRGGGEDLLQERWGGAAAQTSLRPSLVRWVDVMSEGSTSAVSCFLGFFKLCFFLIFLAGKSLKKLVLDVFSAHWSLSLNVWIFLLFLVILLT